MRDYRPPEDSSEFLVIFKDNWAMRDAISYMCKANSQQLVKTFHSFLLGSSIECYSVITIRSCYLKLSREWKLVQK